MKCDDPQSANLKRRDQVGGTMPTRCLWQIVRKASSNRHAGNSIKCFKDVLFIAFCIIINYMLLFFDQYSNEIPF